MILARWLVVALNVGALGITRPPWSLVCGATAVLFAAVGALEFARSEFAARIEYERAWRDRLQRDLDGIRAARAEHYERDARRELN